MREARGAGGVRTSPGVVTVSRRHLRTSVRVSYRVSYDV